MYASSDRLVPSGAMIVPDCQSIDHRANEWAFGVGVPLRIIDQAGSQLMPQREVIGRDTWNCRQ
jgi:hypothetical protein